MTKENDDIAIYNFTCGKQNLTKEMNNIQERFSFWEEGVFSFMPEFKVQNPIFAYKAITSCMLKGQQKSFLAVDVHWR